MKWRCWWTMGVEVVLSRFRVVSVGGSSVGGLTRRVCTCKWIPLPVERGGTGTRGPLQRTHRQHRQHCRPLLKIEDGGLVISAMNGSHPFDMTRQIIAKQLVVITSPMALPTTKRLLG